MGSQRPRDGKAAILDRHWREATALVIRTQIEYATLLSTNASDDRAVATTWLRLWRAQEIQRRCARELDQVERGPVQDMPPG